MGRDWDDLPPGLPWAQECLRVLKPGGHLLAFGGSRTWHRLAVAVEDAGFEVRDSIAWLYGSGFPKSLNVATAVDKLRASGDGTGLLADEAKFCEWMREHSGLTESDARRLLGSARFLTGVVEIVNTATVEAPRMGRRAMVPTSAAWTKVRPHLATIPPAWVEDLVKNPPQPSGDTPGEAWNPGKGQGTAGDNEWQGWGTALKPAFEPIVVGRKPLVDTVAGNVLAHGTGALNIDGCRVPHASAADLAESAGKNRHADFGTEPGGNAVYGDFSMVPSRNYDGTAGRWPTNVVLDGSQADALDEQSGTTASRIGKPRGAASGDGWGMTATGAEYDDRGGASRFFPTFRYEAKAPTAERPRHGEVAHPTVKPLDLMRWLVRLVTPPGGTVLEPFAGSGTTAEACVIEGFRCIAIEREAAYLPLIVARLSKPIQVDLFGGVA
jgi:hypothetical protein